MSIRTSKKNKQEVSISLPVGTDKDGNEISLNDILGTDPDEIVDNLDLKFRIRALYHSVQHSLTEREKEIITKRYGLFGKEPKTQREIAPPWVSAVPSFQNRKKGSGKAETDLSREKC